MPTSLDDQKYYEWDGLAENWISKWESYDQDFPTQPYKGNVSVGGTEPVATWILEEIFGLTVGDTLPTQSPVTNTLPGYDIKNRDAYQMVQLSLATHIADNVLYECYMDEEGIVRYYDIGNESANLDILYEIPTETTVKPADIVMVQGYDPPIRRVVKGRNNNEVDSSSSPGYNLLEFAKDMDLTQHDFDDKVDPDQNLYPIYYIWGEVLGPEQCEYYKEAYIEYGNPHFDQEKYLVPAGLYDPRKYEDIASYIYKIEVPFFKQGSTRMSFHPTTPRYVVLDGMGKLQTRKWISDQKYVSEFCETGEAAKEGIGVSLPRSDESRFLGIKEVYIYGFKIKQMIPDFYEDGNNRKEGPADFMVDVDTVLSEPWRLTQGQDFIVVPNTDNVGYRIIFSCNVHADYLDNFGGSVETTPTTTIRISPASVYVKQGSSLINHPKSFGQFYANPDDLRDLGLQGLLRDGETEVDAYDFYSDDYGNTFTIYPTGEGNTGYVVKKLIVIYDWNNPCIAFYNEDIEGESQYRLNLENLKEFKIQFYPVVNIDEPAPVAVDGELLDFSETLPDYDATTIEDLGSVAWARAFASLENGDVNLSLPFLDADGCKQVSNNIRNFLGGNKTSLTKTILCSPESSPVLGADVGDDLVINSIDYNYQDGSQYTISVQAGPVWLGMSGWENSLYQGKTERLTLDGIVNTVDASNHKCQVRLDQLGVMECINGTKDILEKGDRVSVQVFNNPVST